MTLEHKMSIRPQLTDKEYVAITNLEHNQDFKTFVEYINRRAIDTALLSTGLVGEQSHWVQGRSQELTDLFNCIKKARENYEMIRKGGKK